MPWRDWLHLSSDSWRLGCVVQRSWEDDVFGPQCWLIDTLLPKLPFGMVFEQRRPFLFPFNVSVMKGEHFFTMERWITLIHLPLS